jgi:hypothetical protein
VRLPSLEVKAATKAPLSRRRSRRLYTGTPWEAEVVTDRRNLEKFKEAAHTIDTVLLVRVLAKFF